MRERVLLVAGVVVLVGGLAVWAALAKRTERADVLGPSTAAAPPIGEPVGPDDPAAAPDRALLRRAGLSGLPLVRLWRRAGVPVHGVIVPGRHAVEIVDRLRAVEAEERVPVVIGDGWSVRAHAEAVATTGDPPEAIVRRARAFDVEAWLRARGALVRADEGSWPQGATGAIDERWGVTREPRFGLPRPEVAIALLPARDPVEAPAHLAFGNWEGCPEPTVHVAVLERWRARWGAEIVAVGADGLELRVSRPPREREAALALAREQVAYAPALLGDGRRTIADVAAARLDASRWAFRWPRRVAIER